MSFWLVESLFAHHSEEHLDAARQRNRATGDWHRGSCWRAGWISNSMRENLKLRPSTLRLWTAEGKSELFELFRQIRTANSVHVPFFWSKWTSLWPGSVGESRSCWCRLWKRLRYGKVIQAQLNLKALSHPLHCHTHVFARRSLWHKPLPVENKNAHKIKPILLSWYWNYAQWSTWSSLGKVLHQWFMHCNWAEFLTRQGNLAWRVICLQDQCSTKVYKVTPLLESLDIGVIRHWSH